MKPLIRPRLTLLALALLAAFGTAQAQTAPAGVVEGSVSIGAGVVSGDRADRTLSDQYTGLRPDNHVLGLFGAEYYRRDDEKGSSVEFRASELLGGNRELGLRWKRQGDWKFSGDYRESVRRETGVFNTGMVGAGTTTPQVLSLGAGPGTGSDMDLKIKRTSIGLGLSKIISPALEFEVSVQSERKEGSRLWGIGMNCPSPMAPGCRGTNGAEVGWAVLMMPEPIDSHHNQLEARLSYAGDKLRLSGGYYGSFYSNALGSMTPTVPGSLNSMLGAPLPLSAGLQPLLNQAVALPPDNQAHHLDLSGNYSFTGTTHLNFKLGYSQASQNQSFASAGLTGAPAGVTDLGGKVSTTLAQVGLSARPMPKLSLLANLRYENRDDQTPLALYNLEGANVYTNRRLPLTTVRGKVQAAYQFSSQWRGTLGADFHNIDRGTFTSSSAIGGITALRQKTDETGVRAELRRQMTQDLSGAVSVETSRRGGSNWLKDNSGTGVTEVTDPAALSTGFFNGIFMPNLVNRHRDKLKLHADWQPSEELALQFVAETGRDKFDSPSAYGVRRSGVNSLSVDWTYALTDNWRLNGYVSHGRQELDQARPEAAFMAFDNATTTLGVGFSGKPMSALEVGGMLSFMNDRSVYAQTLDGTGVTANEQLLAATGGLPNIIFRQTALKLFGKYTLDKQSAVRLEFIHQRTRWNDWAWGYNGVPFVFSDGSTVSRNTKQSVSFIGATYIHRWP